MTEIPGVYDRPPQEWKCVGAGMGFRLALRDS
jgi:hypothetical protein